MGRGIVWVLALGLVVPWNADAASTLVLDATADSVLRYAHPDQNDGAAEQLLLKTGGGIVRSLVGFDIPSLGQGRVLVRATLLLTITRMEKTWGSGRYVAVHRMREPWVEGNGRVDEVSWFRGLKPRPGSGEGVTWNCAIDTRLGDPVADCATGWAGGTFVSQLTDAVLHVNGMAGAMAWDMTEDVADLIAAGGEVSWIVKKENEKLKGGKVYYYSREGAAYLKKPALGPRLILEFD